MSVLVFTVAQNGYSVAFSQCLAAQRAYAKKLGFDYVAVNRPFRVPVPALSAWLKIPLIAQALESGYEWVAFIDSDARPHTSTPDFRGVARDGKSVFMANGRSERLNSGVIFARNDPASRAYFADLMTSLSEVIPEEERAHLKFENGNVIHCAKRTNTIEVLGPEWNNAADPDLDDYIRHYTGPLRPEYPSSRWREFVFRVRKKWVHPSPPQPPSRDAEFIAALSQLTRDVTRIYPALVRSSR